MMAAGCASLDAAAIHCCSETAKNQQPKASSQHYPLPVEITQNEDCGKRCCRQHDSRHQHQSEDDQDNGSDVHGSQPIRSGMLRKAERLARRRATINLAVPSEASVCTAAP